MARAIDTLHMGHDRVICAWEAAPGVIVDPGPSTTIDTVLASVQAEPRALLLTHIHLDHAGGSGVLARRFPDLRVYVHEAGAPHVVDPSRLVESAGRLYGDAMEALWGEVAPVPEDRVTVLRGGERVDGCRVEYAPGHARHHVIYMQEESGDAFVGDVAGVRIPPSELTMAPTPPPEIDVEAWLDSLAMLRELGARRLCLTHFGAVEDVPEQLDRVERWLVEARDRTEPGQREPFAAWLDAAIDREPADVAARMRQAMPPAQLWLGLERYWKKRHERAG